MRANYSLASSTLSTTADITELAVTGHFTAADKVYDGNVGATINGRSVSGEVAGDDVVLTGGSATFGSKNVGQDKQVTGTGFVLSGADAANYSLASSTLSTTADITELAVTGHFTAADKVYDGNVGATINGRSVSGEVAGDDVVADRWLGDVRVEERGPGQAGDRDRVRAVGGGCGELLAGVARR